jgi:hypothetical protein
MKTYEIITSEITNKIVIKATSDTGEIFWIPTDPANSDYQAYLAQLEEGDS